MNVTLKEEEGYLLVSKDDEIQFEFTVVSAFLTNDGSSWELVTYNGNEWEVDMENNLLVEIDSFIRFTIAEDTVESFNRKLQKLY